MGKAVSVAFAIAAASFLIPGVQIAATFDPARLRLVDQTSTAVLVRGNAPLNKRGLFDPALVVNNIQSRLMPNRNLTGYKVIIVSLLSEAQSDEREILDKQRDRIWVRDDDGRPEEAAATTTSTHVAEVRHRPVVGSWLAPPPTSALPSLVSRLIWNTWRPDDGAWDLAFEIRRILVSETTKNEGKRNSVVYVHCMRGIDRTGLVAGAYMLRFLNVTKEDVMMTNYDVARRELNWPARNALRWVAWWSEHHSDS